VAVSADGTLLRGTSVQGSLPTVSLPVSPGGTRVTGSTLEVVRLLAAAPYQLLGKVSQASAGSTHGLAAQLRNGPKLYFGNDADLAAKWTAAAAVLADPASAGADYIDVSVASRPAAGAGSDTASSDHSASSQDSAAGPAGTAGSSASTGSTVGG
jgi:Cell division protein FtsQ/DivIB, C-terminal